MAAHPSVPSASLPGEYTSFVGRRPELKAARASLESTRLLTLVGPGGVGKTRLALQLARSVQRLHPDGTWFIDLGRLTADGSVADEAAQVLGLDPTPGDTLDAVVRYLGTKRGLLLLDNCEHVVEDAARFVMRALDDCPRLTVMTTSREPLRLAAEAEYVVPPLRISSEHGEVSPAARLYLERAANFLRDPARADPARADPASADPASADLAVIAEICERLDGMPLAIELAAGRARALTSSQILERLSEPLDVLTSGSRDRPARQQTLRAAIGWSYELCSPAERAFWRRMSVFVGGWDLEAAEWMCEEPALDLVQSLLEKSVVARRRAGQTAGYVMLDTVRMFGHDVSTAAELDVARRRHRDWYLSRLAALEADWYGPRQAYWLSYTQTELPNLRAALEFCIGDHDGASAATLLMSGWRVVWQAHGGIDEMIRWFEQLPALEPPPTPDTCQALMMLGMLDYAEGDRESAQRRQREAEQLAEQLGDDFSLVWALAGQGAQDRDPARRLAFLERASRLQGGRNRRPARANIEERRAIAYDEAGNAGAAAERRRTLIERAIRAGESFETAELLLRAGRLAATRGEFGDATQLMRQSLSLTQNLENPIGIAGAQELLAVVAARRGDMVRAATLLGIAQPWTAAGGAFASSFPYDSEDVSAAAEGARAQLGVRAFDDAYASGAAMTAEQGIAYALGAQLPARPGAPAGDEGSGLTPRESQVVGLVGQGLTDRQIADRLVISPRTAEGHVSNSLLKLGFTSRSQLAAWFARTAGSTDGMP